MHQDVIRDRLIAAGVKNLKEFGYPSVDADNIFTDYVFGAFFAKMLEGTIEDSPVESIKRVCRDLLAKINREPPVDPKQKKGKK